MIAGVWRPRGTASKATMARGCLSVALLATPAVLGACGDDKPSHANAGPQGQGGAHAVATAPEPAAGAEATRPGAGGRQDSTDPPDPAEPSSPSAGGAGGVAGSVPVSFPSRPEGGSGGNSADSIPGAGTETAPIACTPQCPAGDRRCEQGQVESCDDPGDGCPVWTVADSCTTQGQTCVQTETDAFCADPDPTCTDGIQNQDEIGVDCGGETCSPCTSCDDDSDCASGYCNEAGECAPLLDRCAEVPGPNPFAAPHSLSWPLLARGTDQPRPAIGNAFGEFQGNFLHTGIDIRGLEGDHVRVAAGGNIFRPANFAECDEGGGISCRLYIVAEDGRYIYYYSHLRSALSRSRWCRSI